MSINLFWFILLPIIIAVSFYLIKTKHYRNLAILFQTVFFGLALNTYRYVINNGAITTLTGRWKAPIGIVLKADRINFIFVVLTTFVFLILFIYSYRDHYFDHKFMFLCLILEGLLAGIFTSNDLFNIYVLIEVSTIITTILIMYKKDETVIYDGMVYFLLNMTAMMFFLFALGFTYKIFGTLDIDILKEHTHAGNIDRKVLILPYAFFMTAAAFKCGLAPLWGWVTRAYATPAVPAVISMVLAGVTSKSSFIIFYRIDYIFADLFQLDYIFMSLGAITAIGAFIFALSQNDLRKILAYHSVSQMGLIIFAFHLPSKYAFYGALYHSINHSLFKGLLFITLAVLTTVYGSSDIKKIKGVIKEYPYVAVCLIIGMLSITGAPFFNGSISKYYIAKGVETKFLEYTLHLINIGTVLSFVKFSSVLFGESELTELCKRRHRISRSRYIGIYALSFACVIGGVFGPQIMSSLYGVEFTIDRTKYINKSMIYIVMLVSGVLFYKHLYSKIKLFKFIKKTEFDFRIMVSTIALFFTGFTLLLKIIIK